MRGHTGRPEELHGRGAKLMIMGFRAIGAMRGGFV